MLLIKTIHVIDPASNTDGIYDILIKDNKVNKIAKEIPMPTVSSTTVIDGEGLIAAPGLVDVHVHFRDPGFTAKEDIITGANAAKHGGFTTVVMMANTKPTIDNVETLDYVLKKGSSTGIHVEACGNVTFGMQGQKITNMTLLKAAGAVGFTDDGIPLLKEEIAKAAMKQTAKLQVPISFHEEDPRFIRNNGINHGKASEFFGIGGSDRQAEIAMIARDIELAKETGACIDIQHISSKEGVELVRKAKAMGLDVHAEATPHHFSLTEEAAIQYGTLAKMNPPLREEEDRLAIIEGLQDNTIDMIATDHAPHTKEEKERDITKAPSGIIGLETSLALGITNLVNPGYLTMTQLITRMSTGPAKVYHLNAGKLMEGGNADLVIFDPKADYIPDTYASKASNTPFTGHPLKGLVKYTICGGHIVYQA